MDAEKAQKINELAKSLKDNHLVANMEEGIEKAKEILGLKDEESGGEQENWNQGFQIHEAKLRESPKQGPAEDIKTIKELMENEENAAKAAEEMQKEVEEIGEEMKEEEKKEIEGEKEIEEVGEKIKKDEEDIREIRESAEETEKIIESTEEDQ